MNDYNAENGKFRDFDYVNTDFPGFDDLVAIVNGQVVASLSESTTSSGLFELSHLGIALTDMNGKYSKK